MNLTFLKNIPSFLLRLFSYFRYWKLIIGALLLLFILKHTFIPFVTYTTEEISFNSKDKTSGELNVYSTTGEEFRLESEIVLSHFYPDEVYGLIRESHTCNANVIGYYIKWFDWRRNIISIDQETCRSTEQSINCSDEETLIHEGKEYCPKT